eukprot:1160534-Pelagomonas_calceolata.AAC.5
MVLAFGCANAAPGSMPHWFDCVFCPRSTLCCQNWDNMGELSDWAASKGAVRQAAHGHHMLQMLCNFHPVHCPCLVSGIRT